MKERLDGPLADLVAAERDEMESMPRSRDAAWAGIAAAWQLPPPPPPPAGVAEAAAATSGKAGMLKVVAALVVGTSVGAGAWVASRPESVPPARVEAPAVVAAAEAAPEPSVEPEPERIVEPEPEPEPERIVKPEPEPEAKPAAKSKPKPAVVKAGLAEELALIDAMRKDVAAGRHAQALQRAKHHRESFEQGSLTADRIDLEAAARCGAGNLEAGRKLADRKRRRWPRAPLSERLRTLCRLDER